jgi:small subunit ribosomal protein S8
MGMTDPIADMLTRLRNAQRQNFESVEMPASKMKLEMLKIMKAEGFIKNYAVRKRKSHNVIKVFLKYGPDGEPAIEKLARVSKPSRRTYIDKRNIPLVAGGMGTAIISTSGGLMTSQEARKKGVGGELICTMW